jgi:CRISPR-associated protein Csb2
MLIVELKFLAGRFHATPWGRNVNEGVPEWPPSPYRLLRALYDTWKRKRPDWPIERIEPLLAALASGPPRFHLPSAAASHTRAFLSENKPDITKRQKVFDAFVVVSPNMPVLMGWPELTLTEDEKADLEEILLLINYLGRSESWVAAKVCANNINVDWNCVTADDRPPIVDCDRVRVASPIPKEEYIKTHVPLDGPPANRTPQRSPDWLAALSCSTTDLFRSKLSEPPAMRYVSYLRRKDCFDVEPTFARSRSEPRTEAVLFALESKVLPSVTSTLDISERIRRKLMGLHKSIVGSPAAVSAKFSGKNSAGQPMRGHRHAYILPLDRDGDGRLDHLLVACKDPLIEDERLALDRLQSIWQPDGKPDIQLSPLHWGTLDELCKPTTKVVSATPFVPPWHYRRGRGPWAEWLFAQLRQEASNHGLPAPSEIKLVPALQTRQRQFRWIEFRRNRKGDPIRPGYGFELTFAQPVAGPIALGYGAHFGLGHFVSTM